MKIDNGVQVEKAYGQVHIEGWMDGHVIQGAVRGEGGEAFFEAVAAPVLTLANLRRFSDLLLQVIEAAERERDIALGQSWLMRPRDSSE